jgi:hypothetical protein
MNVQTRGVGFNLVMKYKSFRNEFHGYCRRCINQRLGVHFMYEDCEYWEFPETCVSCNEVKNIVVGIKPLSRVKLWKAKKPTDKE